MIDPAQQRKIFTKSSDFGKSSGKLAQKCLQYVEAELSSHQPTETPAKKLSVRHATDGRTNLRTQSPPEAGQVPY